MNNYLAALCLLGMMHFSVHAAVAAPAACSAEKMHEVLAQAGDPAFTVSIDCNLNLTSRDIVTKRMILEGAAATGVTINCNGATLDGGQDRTNYGKDMIEVKSRKTGARTWERPENITITNCNIIGSVRVWGMGKNAESKDIRESSRREKSESDAHVRRARDSAPKNIVFDHVIITGVGRNPLYFAPGVTHSQLINSEMKGKSDRVAIYLDAESAYNTIKNNYIHVVTKSDGWGELPGVVNRGWPLIAIDGSAGNTIMNNTFSSLDNGGIYLYRNCGEGGTIRRTTPSYNLIINNIFYYENYRGGKPAVYLGSRDYGFKERLLGHCDGDDGRPYGSSASDKDLARHNVVMQNQFYKRPVSRGNVPVEASLDDNIKNKDWSSNAPSYIDRNQMVSAETVVQNRPAGCYEPNGHKNFIFHGESIDVFKNGNGEPACTGSRHTCNDGESSSSAASDCEIVKVSFDCSAHDNNSGCHTVASCPAGRKIVGATAACGLESGAISDGALATFPPNSIRVVRTSDHVSEGRCYVGTNSVMRGQKTMSGIDDLEMVPVGCIERDKNGGDCHIKGTLYCR